MTTADERIGQRVAALRTDAAQSQASLAADMSRHGFKWSQATVWAVESGRRPLRLAEAAVIAYLYFIDVGSLLSDDAIPEPRARTADEILKSIESEVQALRSAI